MPRAEPEKKNLYRDLPSVDELLRSPQGIKIAEASGAAHAATLARLAVERVRESLANGDQRSAANLLADSENEMTELWTAESLRGVGRVINATGVIIHTNLGRAPLSEAAKQAVIDASGYCTLEYDLETGKRGRRGKRTEELIVQLTGAEDALVVNNCAAAAFFVLDVFAAGGEVVISRGELVEIGGDFRVPDVLEQSGATLQEVGTTNRTKLSDYEKAISTGTRLLLRVHPSNYRIVGFTATPSVSELAGLAHKNNILLYEDLGSGALVDLSEFGLKDEPHVSRSLADGADIVTFSGDKLLGGPQCGIIAGRRELIEKLRNHPLQRALRVDKKTFAALEATLASYRRGTHFEDIPVLRQLSAGYDTLRSRAETVAQAVTGLEIVDGNSVIGGGAGPDVHPRTPLLAVAATNSSVRQFEFKLRTNNPPVIARIENDRVMLDLRTVDPSDDSTLTGILKGIS
jgi:L-seryl-tRNA(Ser) seleniumtransferase